MPGRWHSHLGGAGTSVGDGDPLGSFRLLGRMVGGTVADRSRVVAMLREAGSASRLRGPASATNWCSSTG